MFLRTECTFCYYYFTYGRYDVLTFGGVYCILRASVVRALSAFASPVSSSACLASRIPMVWLEFLNDTIYSSYPRAGRVALLRWIRLNVEFVEAVRAIERSSGYRVLPVGFLQYVWFSFHPIDANRFQRCFAYFPFG